MEEYLSKISSKNFLQVEVKRFQCGYCEFSSVTKLSVDRHMTTHTKEKRTGALAPLFCSYCGDTVPTHAKLSKHVRLEHGATAAIPKKVYECSSCEYKAGTHSLLKAHVRYLILNSSDLLLGLGPSVETRVPKVKLFKIPRSGGSSKILGHQTGD